MLSDKKIKEQVVKLQSALISFEELDMTGVLHKVSVKSRISFTIDSEVFRVFRNFCKDNGYKMSQLLEKFMEDFVRG